MAPSEASSDPPSEALPLLLGGAGVAKGVRCGVAGAGLAVLEDCAKGGPKGVKPVILCKKESVSPRLLKLWSPEGVDWGLVDTGT